MRWSGLSLLLSSLLGLAGCLEVADGRARRDATIGVASRDGVSVRVADGLAHVRALQRDELRLWAQAPSLAFDLALPGGTASFSVVIANAPATAALTVVGGQATPAPREGAPPTERRWTIVPEATVLQVALAPPGAEDPVPFRFAVYADVQERIDDVQDIYQRMGEHAGIRFALMSGDLTEQGSKKELARFERELRTLPFPVYATLGNHELGVRDDLFHDFFGRGNFSFTHAGVRFTLLDSASATLAPRVYDWLDAWLTAGRGGLHIVAMHIPPLDPSGFRNGAFASRIEAGMLVGRLAAAGVDLTLYGHVHSYKAFSNAGIPAYISGGGGAIPERLDGIGRHYLAVDVDPTRQTLQVAVVRID